MANISIFASVGCKNLGDELILKNEINIFENTSLQQSIFGKKLGDIHLKVATYDTHNTFLKQENISYFEYFPIGLRERKNILRNIKNGFSFFKTLLWSDYIIIGGGGLFYDSELQVSEHNLLLWKKRIDMMRRFHKKIIFFGVSIDTKKEESKEIIKQIFSGSYNIFVRDAYSQKYLENMKIESTEIFDPVFFDRDINISLEEMIHGKEKKSLCLGVFPSDQIDLQQLKDIDFSSQTVGLALRKGYLSKTKRKEFDGIIVEGLIKFLLEHGANKIILLPHSFHPGDEDANDFVFLEKYIDERVEISFTLEETYKVYTQQKIDICFAMRLHAIILSEVYDIPYIALSYSEKTKQTIKKIT